MKANSINLASFLALQFHAGQTYGIHNYSYHLTAVVDSVNRENSTDDRLTIIAWLHDILEDTLCKEDTLRNLFDNDIVDAVVALTRNSDESKSDYITRVKKNELARFVKKHDTMCNLTESFYRGDNRRIKKYTAQLSELIS